jgi:hypothetical protein
LMRKFCETSVLFLFFVCCCFFFISVLARHVNAGKMR